VVFGGDFHQTLPMEPKGTCQQVVAVSLCRGNLWGYIKFLHLRQNMCLGHSEADNQHAQWLLEIGARSTMDNNKMIQVPQSMVCANLNGLINRIYPGISNTRAQDDRCEAQNIFRPKNNQILRIHTPRSRTKIELPAR